MNEILRAIERVYKEEYGRVIATLTFFSAIRY